MPELESLQLTKEWDKVFPKSEKINHEKVTFHNKFGITLAADLYRPKDATGKLPALAVAAQRTADYRSGTYALAGGVVDPLPEDAPGFVKDYHSYYKTPRGYHPRSLNSNDGWTVIGGSSLMNATLLGYIEEIENAVMIVHGEAAHSYYMGKDAFARLQGDNKEFVSIPGASHTDLYDGGESGTIPWERITEFLAKNL